MTACAPNDAWGNSCRPKGLAISTTHHLASEEPQHPEIQAARQQLEIMLVPSLMERPSPAASGVLESWAAEQNLEMASWGTKLLMPKGAKDELRCKRRTPASPLML